MRAWVIRGVVLALLHAIGQTALAAVAVYQRDALEVLRPVALLVLVLVALFYAAVDGLRGRADPGLLWLKASLLAGLLAGLLGVAGRALLVDRTGTSALGDALTGGAAFTALLVLLPAALGLLLARFFGPSGVDSAKERDEQSEEDGGSEQAGARSAG